MLCCSEEFSQFQLSSCGTDLTRQAQKKERCRHRDLRRTSTSCKQTRPAPLNVLSVQDAFVCEKVLWKFTEVANATPSGKIDGYGKQEEERYWRWGHRLSS